MFLLQHRYQVAPILPLTNLQYSHPHRRMQPILVPAMAAVIQVVVDRALRNEVEHHWPRHLCCRHQLEMVTRSMVTQNLDWRHHHHRFLLPIPH
jgi:hypothetical protein